MLALTKAALVVRLVLLELSSVQDAPTYPPLPRSPVAGRVADISLRYHGNLMDPSELASRAPLRFPSRSHRSDNDTKRIPHRPKTSTALIDDRFWREIVKASASRTLFVMPPRRRRQKGTTVGGTRTSRSRFRPMARQTFWKGYLRLSLVTAAVKLTPATTESNKVRFHVLNRKTKNRVESRYLDSVTHKPVVDKDQVKGYQKDEGNYVLIEDDEIDALGLESTRTIDIDTFVSRETIDWIWYEKPHFLSPADKVGTEAFCVIREAMEASGVVGIARLVLYRRERVVLLEASGKGIILWTLRYGDEVREPTERIEAKTKVDRKLLKVMTGMVEERTGPWSSKLVQDPVQKRMKALLAKKQKASKPTKTPKNVVPVKTEGNVINIMDALKKSLARESRKRPSK